MHTLSLNDSATGLVWAIRVIEHGETYGLRNCLTHTGAEPLVEFFDTRYPHTPIGQFVSRYYRKTLLEPHDGRGLCLDGGIPEWSVSGELLQRLTAWLRTLPATPAGDAGAQSFRDKMLRLFGSDEALGVTLALDEAPYDTLTPADYQARFGHLPPLDQPSAQSLLSDGSSAVFCTNYARLIQRTLAGEHKVQVVGFACEDNPVSRIGREHCPHEGHDFAWIDDRYIVDPWLTLVASEGNQFVFDAQDPRDAARMLDLYGAHHCWRDLDTDEPARLA